VSPPSLEDRNRSSFRNVVISAFLEHQTMDEGQKDNSSEDISGFRKKIKRRCRYCGSGHEHRMQVTSSCIAMNEFRFLGVAAGTLVVAY
jgi:hypothetical protein